MAAALVPGSIFGQYEILEELREGGMGRVFRARHLPLEREVALKVLAERFASDETYRLRFLKEARAVARLNHPNIVQVYDFGRVETTIYLAMELVRGISVGDRLRREGAFSEREALGVVRQACVALGVAHAAGIIHRDVKPDNLILADGGLVKLVDLGLAKSLSDDQNLTQSGVVSGTPHYISPEQIAGSRDIDGRADIYSLGATLFHMVTGRTPFEGSSPMVVVAKHLHDQPDDPRTIVPGLSAGICGAIRTMMARDRDQRFPDVQAVDEVLRTIGTGEAAPTIGGFSAAGTVPTRAHAPEDAGAGAQSGWDPGLLAAIEDRLAAAIGPLAKVLVAREARRGTDPERLCAGLARHIPTEEQRAQFLAEMRAAVPVGTQSPGHGPPVDPTPARPGPGAAAGPASWDAEVLRAVEGRLAEAIGPVARVLVKKASRTASSWDELVSTLAANLPGPGEQAAFRAEALKLAG